MIYNAFKLVYLILKLRQLPVLEVIVEVDVCLANSAYLLLRLEHLGQSLRSDAAMVTPVGYFSPKN